MNFNKISLNWLRVFNRVMQDRNATTAADALCVTQSAISHSLNQLRQALGDPLFRRTPAGMVPTATALDIAPDIDLALKMMQNALQNRMFDPATSDRLFTLVCGDYTSMTMLPALACEFRKRAPAARLQVKPISRNIARRLADGEADLFINGSAAIPGTLKSLKLFNESMVWAVGSHLNCGAHTTLDDIRALPKIIVSLGYADLDEEIGGFTRRSGMTLWTSSSSVVQQEGSDAEPKLIVDGFLPAALLLQSTDCAAALPRRMAEMMERHFAISIVAPVSGASGEIRLVWHSERGNHAPVAWFRNLFVEVMGEQTADLPA